MCELHLTNTSQVNGKPQGISFQRTTGYCEQNDVHEPTATVSEALLFSARLRQSYSTPDTEKVEYVNRIMDLLELTPLQHAIVGSKFAPIFNIMIAQLITVSHGLWLVNRATQKAHACS